MGRIIAWRYKKVRGGIECTGNVVMPCGKGIDGQAVRPDERTAKNLAGAVLAEAVKVHLAKCTRGCNR